MVGVYFFLLCLMLTSVNIFFVWILMEFMTLVFFLIVLKVNSNDWGLVVYYFFQSVLGLMLMLVIFVGWMDIVVWVILAKLGLFPFFYWVVVVSVKVSLLSNMYVLGFQKMGLFWLLWLCMVWSLIKIMVLVYSGIVFGILMLIKISDLWLFLVYSSIVNSGFLLMMVYGFMYLWVVGMYLMLVVWVIWWMKYSESFNIMMVVIYYFLVVPPFFLFMFKILMISSLVGVIKVVFFMLLLDVFLLVYYFGVVFMNLLIGSIEGMYYWMNLLMLLMILLLSNYVTLIIFY